MRKTRLPTEFQTKLRKCPTGCTQRRTRNYRLAERNTFDGHRCSNCGFSVRQGLFRPSFRKYGTAGQQTA